MLDRTVNHLIENVLPTVIEYGNAEAALSQAFIADPADDAWRKEAQAAKRKACALAVAIDGLTDRLAKETGQSKTSVRRAVKALCYFGIGGSLREDAHQRIRGVAVAYKHDDVSDTSLPMRSIDDVLVVGLGFGLEGYGVGKDGRPEVLVTEKDGTRRKFMGDVVAATTAWCLWLSQNGASLPSEPIEVINVRVHP